MAPIKKVIGSVSDSLESACGVALCMGLAYALLFVDLTGNGRLWDAMRSAVSQEGPAQSENVSMREYHVAPRDYDSPRREQNRMFQVDFGGSGLQVPVVVARPAPATAPIAPPEQLAAPKDWRVHLQGSLPEVATSGPASQSRTVSVAGSAASQGSRAVASAPAAPTSAYRAGSAGEPDIVATPRPGISDRATTWPSAAASDGVQNFR
jgi:hypothetical protein